MTFFSHLSCSRTGEKLPVGKPATVSPAGAPLLARYDLAHAGEHLTRGEIAGGPSSMWRWSALLPVSNSNHIVSLGEGNTPLIPAGRLGHSLGAANVLVKDESANPTGTFKARGMSCAVSMAKESGVEKLAAPSAGNAGSALAAYAAAAGIEAHIFMPRDVPRANYIECRMFGAHVNLVDGLISDCGRLVAEGKDSQGWFDVSSLKQPYRIEGKKTMGLELAEQLGWRLPDAILYPTGGGVGIIGMWKAFDELEELGWIDSKRPKMVVVQAEGCAPIVRAFEQGGQEAEPWDDARTIASGLRVPEAGGAFLVLEAVRKSQGTCIAVSDQEILAAGRLLAGTEGLFVAPEAAACVAALEKLLRQAFLKPDDEIVLFNTGTGLKYLETWSTQFAPEPRAEERLGGLILPR